MSHKSFDDRAFAIARYAWFNNRATLVTVGEVARRFDISRTHAKRLLDRMSDEGMTYQEDYFDHCDRRRIYYKLTESVRKAFSSQKEMAY